jgi:predicted transcriptional regulator
VLRVEIRGRSQGQVYYSVGSLLKNGVVSRVGYEHLAGVDIGQLFSPSAGAEAGSLGQFSVCQEKLVEMSVQELRICPVVQCIYPIKDHQGSNIVHL